MRIPARAKLVTATVAAALAMALQLAPATPAQPEYLATPNSFPAPQHSGVAEAAPVATNSTNSVYYKQTGHYLKDAFLNYWLMNGGAALYGYPISEEFNQGGVPMQYFERARMEYNAKSTRPWKVELSNVGSIVTEGRGFQRVNPPTSSDRLYFEQTGHTLGGSFKQYWSTKGGVAIFGYPISEEFRENGKTVQYFERARFEIVGNAVQLGHVGREAMGKHQGSGMPAGVASAVSRPGFNMSFRGEATVFNANWDRVISLNKGWGNLPKDYVGRGLYAAAPADLYLYGRWARVTRNNRSIYVQFIDVINWPDIPYVRNKGIVIDLGQEAFERLGQYRGGRYEVNFEVFWPEDEP